MGQTSCQKECLNSGMHGRTRTDVFRIEKGESFIHGVQELTRSLAYNVHELADSPIDYVEAAAANHSLDR